MNQRVVGLKPWLPWPLGEWNSWTEPVRAERLAALRIGVALVLLLDVCAFYLPHVADYFGAGSLGSPEVFAARVSDPIWNWSLLSGVEAHGVYTGMLVAWLVIAVCLLFGLGARTMAFAAWIISVSIWNANPYLHNGGDRIRTILLFYLMLAPCGAAWSLDAWRKRRTAAEPGPAFIHPWPLRLLFVQMALVYFMNGVYKVIGPGWREGNVTHYLLQDLTFSRFADASWDVPYAVTQALTWTVLAWELGFPLLVALRPLRNLTLWLGVAFHVASLIGLEIGPFGLYMLCFYLPLVPWEKWVSRRPCKITSYS